MVQAEGLVGRKEYGEEPREGRGENGCEERGESGCEESGVVGWGGRELKGAVDDGRLSVSVRGILKDERNEN